MSEILLLIFLITVEPVDPSRLGLSSVQTHKTEYFAVLVSWTY